MRLKKMTAGAVAAAMMAAMMCGTAFAAEPADGDYTGEIHFLNANGSGNNSMCDPIFCHEAKVILTNDAAELTFYVAYPIPAFADQGTDGTVKDVVLTVDGTEYAAESDITTKLEKEFDTDAALFGISAGDVLPTQVLTVELPRDVLDDLEAGTVSASAYVNVVMNSTQNFFVQVTDLQADPTAEPGQPEETETHDMQISAEISDTPSAPSYMVSVPSAVSMGTLDADKENIMNYTVDVTASDLNGGTLTVTAPDAGELTDAEGNKLAFTNDFGTKTANESADAQELSGSISITAEAVAAAAAGNYTGTTTFSISYAVQ